MDEKFESLLRKIEHLDQRHSFTQLKRTSAEFLQSLVIASGARAILELGTAAGYSALYMASAVSRFGGRVYTIEIDPIRIDLAHQHFRESGLSNITLLEGDIMHHLSSWNVPLDFLFIDAQKGTYLSYLKGIEPHLKQGAIIVADNILFINNRATNVTERMLPYVEYVTQSKDYVSTLVSIDNGLMVSRKIT